MECAAECRQDGGVTMTKQVITIHNAPKYPFSPGIRAGDCIFVSGQGGFQDPETGESVEGIEAQTKLCIENVKKVLDINTFNGRPKIWKGKE